MTNNILAIPAAPAAIPPKPKTAAMMAIIKKVTVQRNIIVDFKFNNNFFERTHFERIQFYATIFLG